MMGVCQNNSWEDGNSDCAPYTTRENHEAMKKSKTNPLVWALPGCFVPRRCPCVHGRGKRLVLSMDFLGLLGTMMYDIIGCLGYVPLSFVLRASWKNRCLKSCPGAKLVQPWFSLSTVAVTTVTCLVHGSCR